MSISFSSPYFFLTPFQANVGDLDDRMSRYGILYGNMALLQVQATLVSFIAACLSFVLGFITPTPEATQQSASAAIGMGMAHLLSRRPHPKPVVDPSKPRSGLAECVFFLIEAWFVM